MTVKGKTNTNGYPFKGVNHLLSIRHLFERPILLFTVTNLKKKLVQVTETSGIINYSNYFPYLILNFIWNTIIIMISFSKSPIKETVFSIIARNYSLYCQMPSIVTTEVLNKVFNLVCLIASPIFKLTKNFQSLKLWVACCRKW